MRKLLSSRLQKPLSWLIHDAHAKIKYSSGFATITPVKLAYDGHIPPGGNEKEQPLLIIHGFFGSKRNWQSLSKAFAKDLGRPVYTLDLRNQGSSPHVRPMTYTHMAADVIEFCTSRSLTNVSLLGHSMGGKVAMSIALNPDLPQDLLSHLIVSDIAPVRAEMGAESQRHIKGMKKIEEAKVSSRKEAGQILADYEQDPSVRAFLLTNLEKDSHSSLMKFKIPLDIIEESLTEIGSFPYVRRERAWEGPALFVKGKKSPYINRRNMPLIAEFFPNAHIEELHTGHWVHAEMPNEFKSLVIDFITK